MIDANQSIISDEDISSASHPNSLTIRKVDLPIAIAFLSASAIFGNSSTQTTDFLWTTIYGLISTICFVNGIIFCWLCKKRISDKIDLPLKERLKKMCPRCIGIVLGASIIVFPLIIISTEFTPILDTNWKVIFLIFGFLLSLPAASHGLYHGVQKKEFRGALDKFISILSGFCLSLGGYLIFLSLVSIFG